MTKELTNQIEAMVENYCTEFMDAYQCMNWGIPRANLLIF